MKREARTIDRQEAATLLATHRAGQLSASKAHQFVDETCGYTDRDDFTSLWEETGLPPFPDATIAAALAFDSTSDPLSETLRPLLVAELVWDLRRATSQYIAEELATFGVEADVIGEPIPSDPCPCCGYLSIDVGEDGLWDICRVCWWENGGDGPNHMSLADAQRAFQELGAISPRALRHVERDGKRKYAASQGI